MDFDFSQSMEVANLEGVPEQFRPLYGPKAEGEGFVLKVDDPAIKGAVEAILGHSKALKASRAEAKALKGKVMDLSPLSEYGASVEEIRAGIEAKVTGLEDQIKGGKQAKIDLDRARAEIAAGFAKEKEALAGRAKSLMDQLEALLADNAARTELADAVDPDLVLPFVKSNLRVVEDEGKFQAFVVDADGNRRYSGVTGQPMTIKELVGEMRASEKYRPLFKSETRRGSGSVPGSSAVSDRSLHRQSRESMSATEKIAEGLRKRGPR